jgi:hypothetical protein
LLAILIPSAWLAIVFFALAMCHLAARSDESHDVAMAEQFATSNPEERETMAAGGPPEQLTLDPQRRVYRRMG